MPDQEDKPTIQFAEPVDDSLPTANQDSPETDPTKINSVERFENTYSPAARDENALRPSRLRFGLICLLFIFTSGWLVLNNFNLFSQNSSLPGWYAAWSGEHYSIVWIDPNFDGRVRVGDEVLSLNGQAIDKRYKYRLLFRQLGAGEMYSLQMRREGQIYGIELAAKPIAFEFMLNTIFLGIVTPAVFFLTGLFAFLFKRDDRLIVLIAVSFSLIAMSTSPLHMVAYAEAPLLALIWQIGYFLELFGAPVLLHFFLLFPKPSPFVRRFPLIQVLIYLPFLLYVVPTEIAQQLAYNGISIFDIFIDWQILILGDFIYAPYLVLNLIVLILNYRNADEHGKRRMRVLMAGVPFAVAPFILTDLILPPVEWILESQFLPSAGWRSFAANITTVVAPPIFAYAVIRHRVIPISFIIRRGLQYIFAKNGLLLLVVVPVTGIVWNIAVDPDRTLSDLIFRNSPGFYLFVVLAVGFGLLLRFRLSVWIDRRFFREQYDQERLLGGLVEKVKDSDSMLKISRLVSSQIQMALHPSNVHFFYEDKSDSDFSLGYVTSENSENMKLAADSPLLRFMQQEHKSVEFPSRETDGLPFREKAWLKQVAANLLVPIHGTDGKLAGFFSLGEKLSEIPYTGRDKGLLETLANQIALVQENLTLKDKVRREQTIKAQVLSRFEEGNINLLKECPACGKCYDREVNHCDDDGVGLTLTLPVMRTLEDRYRLERLIGKGGMGSVYEASDLRISRKVAVKILSGSMFGNREALRRFEREAQTAGRLQHPNIVTVFDYGVLSTEGAFLVLELIRGESLADVQIRKGKSGLSTVKSWFTQILDGVNAAHQAGVIHRDLKPDNVLVSNEDLGAVRLCVLDFGIARLHSAKIATEQSVTMPGTILGTFGYMSPEQLRGERADKRSDLFSVAVMIYEALHGTKPFQARSYHEFLKVMSSPIPTGAAFAEFFVRGLAFDRDARFASASELKDSLLNLQEDER
ncbi:MAG: protein kinase [Saprospiraceae bacterium]|nr:protein kinase [Pyrinomonadaceae bacterium]